MIPDVTAIHDPLGAEHLTVFPSAERAKNIFQLPAGKYLARLYAPARENFVCMVMMVMFMPAAAFVILIMVMMAASVLLILVVVMAAFMLLILVVVMAVFMRLVLVVVMAVFMLLVFVVVVMAVFMLLRFGGKFFKLGSKAVLLFDRSENVGTLQIVPIRCDDGHIGMLPQ